MDTLIGTQPTSISRQVDLYVFYYGVKAGHIHQLPANTQFSVVYSPKDQWGWEFVCYQIFQELNGLVVLERRVLNADEIAYFELLISTLKLNHGSATGNTDL